jgi:DNA repair protein RecN (Recombination protein N)
MLQLLHIENIAVIEKADISFGPGLNVLTGETGAGKSIVIDALSAVIGGRTSKELIRTGADGANVTAVFSGVDLAAWLSENGIEKDEDGALFLMRKITSDGKTSCRINGCPVTVGQLRELGGMLIDIHGQNDGRKLLDESAHRAYLDIFGGLKKLLTNTAPRIQR